MGYINIVIASDADITIKNKQLVLRNIHTGDSVDYPIEDINSVLIESLRSNISTKTLSLLADNNIITYFCDESHLPSAYLLNYNGFYKNLSVYNMQVSCPKPLQKRLWQGVIKSKISNQIGVLDLCGIDNDLSKYESMVLSGDSTNVESTVALKYFKLLFGDDFGRRYDTIVNASLNYGYSIIRGCIARSVVAHGLLPYLGMHHSNQLNAFNLVDDLIEPFRPVVDLYVYNNLVGTECTELNHYIKQGLVSLLNADVMIDGKVYALSFAVDIVVSSYIESLSAESNKLLLPTVLEYEFHKYE